MANLAVFALAAPLIGATHTEPTWLATFSRLLGTTFLRYAALASEATAGKRSHA